MLDPIEGQGSDDDGERRRRIWPADEKRRVVAESYAPGASVAKVARRYGLNANQLFTWRRRERASGASDVGALTTVVPVRVVRDAAPAAPAATMGRIEIALVGGERIVVGPDVDATALSRIVRALR